MSHEIRTPLNGVIGMTELALDTELTSDQRDLLISAHESAETLLAVVNDILDFSKMEAGRLILEVLDVDLNGLIEFCGKAFALRAHQKKLELACRISPDCPPVIRADPTRLRQILFNLLGNALKFTHQGEIVVRVAPVETGGETVLQFSVSDTGIGIQADRQDSIFDAFSQADASTTRRFGGTGLGLAIARRLVEFMNGKIWLESAPGSGTTFYFSIPLVPAPSRTTTVESTAELDGRHVLIVDDNQTNRRILEEMLRKWGLRVGSVDSGRTALSALAQAKIEDDPYELILLDYQMPEMDGFEVARRIRSSRDFADYFIMMLTSDDCVATIARCRQLGIQRYVVKPVRQGELLSSLQDLLGAGADRKPVQPTPPLPFAAPPRHLRVLLAEDNVVNQKLATRLLERQGHSVTLAETGKQAVDLYRTHEFDVILMDVQMPEMDGLEATAAIRAVESAGSRIPIIALTAHAMKGDGERCLASGMDAYLSKPIRSRDLFRAIHELTAAAPPHVPPC